MKKTIENLKKYFGLEEVQEDIVAIPDAAEKWKVLALELNDELQESRMLHAKALDEVMRLKRICECQDELLAEGRKQNGQVSV